MTCSYCPTISTTACANSSAHQLRLAAESPAQQDERPRVGRMGCPRPRSACVRHECDFRIADYDTLVCTGDFKSRVRFGTSARLFAQGRGYRYVLISITGSPSSQPMTQRYTQSLRETRQGAATIAAVPSAARSCISARWSHQPRVGYNAGRRIRR